jgi:hypothetical protein
MSGVRKIKKYKTSSIISLIKHLITYFLFLFLLAKAASRSRFIDHTTVGRTPLDEGSARRKYLYPTTHNTKKTHIHNPKGFFFIILFVRMNCPGFCLFALTGQHNTNIHAAVGIRTRNPSRRAATDPRLRPLGHWDRQLYNFASLKYLCFVINFIWQAIIYLLFNTLILLFLI